MKNSILTIIFKKGFVASVIIGFFIPFLIYSQGNTIDVVYLKNGSIIKGEIIEMIPNESIKIKTADESIFVYKMDEILKISKSEIKKAENKSEKTENIIENIENRSNTPHPKENIGYGIYGSIAIPLGEFSESTDPNNGFAKIGFGVGVELDIPIGVPSFCWASNISILINSTNFDDFNKLVQQDGAGVKSFVTWKNIPIATGLRYYNLVSPTIGIYGTGQLALNLCLGSSFEVIEEDNDISKWESGLTSDLGFIIGGGIIIIDKLDIGIRYNGLGKPNIEFKSDGTKTYNPGVNISILTISAGIRL